MTEENNDASSDAEFLAVLGNDFSSKKFFNVQHVDES